MRLDDLADTLRFFVFLFFFFLNQSKISGPFTN